MAKTKKTEEVVDSVVKENLTTEKPKVIEEPETIKELRALVESLKCCGNCNNYVNGRCGFSSIGGCKDRENWTIRK